MSNSSTQKHAVKLSGNGGKASSGFESTAPEQIARGLFPHQVEGVAFLLRRRRAILADDMGLGKTRQAVTALKVEAPAGPYLVVCPASVKRNWEREIHQVLPGATVRILAGAGDLAPLPGAEWVVVNYDVLAKHEDKLAAVSWQGLIMDEAHYLRNDKSQRSRSARRIVDAQRDPVVYMLTGTPLMNRPRDVFPLLQLANHSMGRSFLSFAKRYCAAYRNEWGWVTDGASNLEELSTVLQNLMLRRTKDDVLELPPKLRTWLSVDVPEGTASAETTRVVRLLMAGRGITTPGVPLQDAGGPRGGARLLATLSTMRRKLATAKVPHTLDLVSGAVDQGEKVIVFSGFDEPVKKIADHFGEAAVLLTGATPAARRQALVDRFHNDDDVRVFVANIVAGGVGLNLTAARQVVFNDLDWVPSNHWQAEDRAYRIGQTNTVNVTYLVAEGTIDDFVAFLLNVKSQLIQAVVEGDDAAAAAGGGDDLAAELERLLVALSPGLADTRLDDLSEDEINHLLQEATARLEGERIEAARAAGLLPDSAGAADREGGGSGNGAENKRSGKGQAGGAGNGAVTGNGSSPAGHRRGAASTGSAATTEAMRRALGLLRAALAGGKTRRYRADSTSGRGVSYDMKCDDAGDVTCSCPGFEHRGMCNHSRRLSSALAAGGALPEGIRPV